MAGCVGMQGGKDLVSIPLENGDVLCVSLFPVCVLGVSVGKNMALDVALNIE